MAITRVKIRAKIEGAGFSVETPYIQSFSVRKVRNEVSSFSASIKINRESFADDGSLEGLIIISAGVKDNLKKIFTGIVRKANISPCWNDPTYVILNISGEDILSELRNKKITRRQIKEKGPWALITGIDRKGHRSDKFKYINRSKIDMSESGEVEDPNITKKNNESPMKALATAKENAFREEQATLNIQVYDTVSSPA